MTLCEICKKATQDWRKAWSDDGREWHLKCLHRLEIENKGGKNV